MNVVATAIADVKVVEPRVLGDARGFFMETWNARAFDAVAPGIVFVQDNHSRSARGVLRGLHYQLRRPQGKLVRVAAGAIWDVAVDLRRSSPSFGRAVGVELSAENKRIIWIPPGFAHGFLSLADDTDVLYKCTDFYVPEDERALIWNDPALRIDWPLAGITPILSAKDAQALPLGRCETYP